MFSTRNPYDEAIAKATDEKETDANWDTYMNVWEKTNQEGEAGARNCVSAIQKRLQHRSANVQLLALTLAGALVNNCRAPLHREISGKPFMDTLVRLINQRTTHADVKKKALGLIKTWAEERGQDPNFDVTVETYNSLKAQNHKFEDSRPKTPPRASDDVRRREEEELERALALSTLDAGGPSSGGSGGGQGGMAGFRASQPPAGRGGGGGGGGAGAGRGYGQRGGYGQQQGAGAGRGEGAFVPPRESSVLPPSSTGYGAPGGQQGAGRDPPSGGYGGSDGGRGASSYPSTAGPSRTPAPPSSQAAQVKAKAIYDFVPATPGELALKKGDVVTVTARDFDPDWWKGELRGKVGIFPHTYVQLVPEETPDKINAEAQAEAALFAQSASIDKLLALLRDTDPSTSNIAENEELLELYSQAMSLRPKVVKLIERYNKKQDELRNISEKFAMAKGKYEAMMEESERRVAQHSYRPPANYLNAAPPNGGPPPSSAYPSTAGPPPPQQPGPADPYAQQHQPGQPSDPFAGWSEQQKREYQLAWQQYYEQVAQAQAQQAQAQQDPAAYAAWYHATYGQPPPAGAVAGDPAAAAAQGQPPTGAQSPPPADQHQQAYDPAAAAAQDPNAAAAAAAYYAAQAQQPGGAQDPHAAYYAAQAAAQAGSPPPQQQQQGGGQQPARQGYALQDPGAQAYYHQQQASGGPPPPGQQQAYAYPAQ